MYKLMIVDDEYNIREGIAHAIEWEKHDITVVGEAEDGLEALEKFSSLDPDIVITDINMDNMNGLEFAERVRTDYPDVKIIILSGYDEFEYAKKAMELKVFSYILKPVLPEELLSIVLKVANEIQEDRLLKEKINYLEEDFKRNRNMLIDELLKDLIGGRIIVSNELMQREKFLDIRFDKEFYTCMIFDIDGYYDLAQTRTPKEVYIIIQSIKEVIHEMLFKHYDTFVTLDNPSKVIAILGEDGCKNNNSWMQKHEKIERIQERIKNLLGITVTVGVGGKYEDILNIRRSFTEAGMALDYKVILGKNCIVHIDDVVSIDGNKYIYPADKEEMIINSLKEENADKARLGIESFFHDLEEQNYLRNPMNIAVMELFAVIVRKFMDIGINIYKLFDGELAEPYKVLERFDTIEETKNWMANIAMCAIYEIQQNRKNHVKSVIKKAQEFIMQNYSNADISMVSTAEHLYLNAAYFSVLFKKETGKSYIEYLTEVRVDKAKKMLKQANLRIADIGIAVGYLNPQYFCTLFKKVTGLSPAEYREL